MDHRNTVGYEIKTLDHLLIKQLISVCGRQGIDEVTVMNSWIIGYLYENQRKEIFQKDLEQEFSISKSTVTGILQLMEKKGYIIRQSVPYDARLKKLMLTEKGLAMRGKTQKIINQLEERLMMSVKPEEMEVFFHVIHRFKDSILQDLEKDEKRRHDAYDKNTCGTSQRV
ncbi:MAG: MarR family transcriptional regulator [Clostridiales bacterium]|nr:MarR family transcriptional regulator [Clostridiales bacterium]